MALQESYEFFGIEELRKSEYMVLETLATWNYNFKRASAFNISKTSGLSIDGVGKALRTLKDRGLITRSFKGSYALSLALKSKIPLKKVPKSIKPKKQLRKEIDKYERNKKN